MPDTAINATSEKPRFDPEFYTPDRVEALLAEHAVSRDGGLILLGDLLRAVTGTEMDRQDSFYKRFSAVLKSLTLDGRVVREKVRDRSDSGTNLVLYAYGLPIEETPMDRQLAREMEHAASAAEWYKDDPTHPGDEPGHAAHSAADFYADEPGAPGDGFAAPATSITDALALYSPDDDPITGTAPERLPRSSDVRRDYDQSYDSMVEWAAEAVEQMPAEMSVDEAAYAMERLSFRVRLRDDDAMMTRFMMGVVARRIKLGARKGDAVLEQLADEFKINVNTLGYFVRAAALYGDDVRAFSAFLRAGEWTKRTFHIQRLVREGLPVRELGPEETANRVMALIEQAQSEVNRLSGGERETAVLLLSETVDQFRTAGMQALADASEDRTDEAYMAYRSMVASMPCVGTGKSAEGAYRLPSGTGPAPSKWALVPLSSDAAAVLARSGVSGLEKTYRISISRVVAEILHVYVTGEMLILPSGIK